VLLLFILPTTFICVWGRRKEICRYHCWWWGRISTSWNVWL